MFDQAEALAALRATLPAWVGLAPLAFVPIAALSSLVTSWLAVTIALAAHGRLPTDAHWTERARLAWPARVVAAAGPMINAIILGALAGFGTGPLSSVPPGGIGLLCGVVAFLAAYPQIARVENRLKPPRSMRQRIAGQVFAFVVLFPHVLIVLIGGAIMPGDPVGAAIGATIVLALLLAIALGAGMAVARAIGLASPADERLRSIVDACSEKVGVRAKRVQVVRWSAVNAFAFPRTGELAFTEEAVARLSDVELSEITAHELGHLGEPRAVVLARSLGVVALFPIALVRPVARAAGEGDALIGLVSALLLVVMALLLTRIVARVARRMEERADAVAHEHEGDPGAYARALERIYELNLVPAVTRAKRPVHPHLYDRLVSSGVTPSYARPAPPGRAAHRIGLFVLLGGCALAIVTWQIGLMLVTSGDAPPLLAVALRGGSESDLANMGRARWDHGDLDGAVPYYRALSALEPRWAYWPSELSRLYAWQGRCAEASAAFEEAEHRGRVDPTWGVDLVPAWSSVSICTTSE